MPEAQHRPIVEISWRTIVKILAAAALVWLWFDGFLCVLCGLCVLPPV